MLVMQPVFESIFTRSLEFSRVNPLAIRSVGADPPPDPMWGPSYPRDGISSTFTNNLYVCVEESFEICWNGSTLPRASMTEISMTEMPAFAAVGSWTSKVVRSVRDHASGLKTITGTAAEALLVFTRDAMQRSAPVDASSVVHRITS